MKKLTDKQHIKILQKEAKILRDALHFYAHTGTYFATRIITDPPCGEFHRDYSKISEEQFNKFGWDNYRGSDEYYYGKKARKAIEKTWNLWEKAVKE